MSITYRGWIDGDGNCHVDVIETTDAAAAFTLQPLPLRLDLAKHSFGHAWGYGGSGPSQLALALLAHALGDNRRALALYQPFKWKVVARWPQDGAWRLSRAQVIAYANECEAELRADDARWNAMWSAPLTATNPDFER